MSGNTEVEKLRPRNRRKMQRSPKLVGSIDEQEYQRGTPPHSYAQKRKLDVAFPNFSARCVAYMTEEYTNEKFVKILENPKPSMVSTCAVNRDNLSPDKEIQVYVYKINTQCGKYYWRNDGIVFYDHRTDQATRNSPILNYTQFFTEKNEFKRTEYTLLKVGEDSHVLVKYTGKVDLIPENARKRIKKRKLSVKEKMGNLANPSTVSLSITAPTYTSEACLSESYTGTHPSVRENIADLLEKGVGPVTAFSCAQIETRDQPLHYQPRNMKQAQNIESRRKSRLASRDDLYEVYAFTHDVPGHIPVFNLANGVEIVFAHKELLVHVNSLYNVAKKSSGIVLFNLDTTFETAKGCFTTTLTLRHRMFIGDPIITVAVLFHAYTKQASHKTLLESVLRMISLFNSELTVIISDREGSIKRALAEVLPKANRLFCWNHIRKNIAHWTRKNVGRKHVGKYKEETFALMNSSSLTEYHESLNKHKEGWCEKFSKYYDKYEDRDIRTSARWKLEQLNLYNPKSGITNNAAESENESLKTTLSHRETDLGRLVHATYFRQLKFLGLIEKGLRGRGDYIVKEEMKKFLLLIPKIGNSKIDNAQAEKLRKLVAEAKNVSSPNDCMQRQCPEIIKEMADTTVNENRVVFDLEKKCFYVWMSVETELIVFTVSLKKYTCSCIRGGLCSHLLAVLQAVGRDDDITIYNILKRKTLNMGKLLRKTSNAKSGRKGPALHGPRSSIRTFRSHKEEYIKSTQTNSVNKPSKEIISSGRRNLCRTSFDSVSISESNSVCLGRMRKFDLSQLPELSEDNKSDVLLKCQHENLKLLDVKSLQTKLEKAEVQILSTILNENYTIGYLADSVITAFLQSACESDEIICFTPNVMNQFFLFEEGVLPVYMPLELGEKSNPHPYNWASCKMILMPHNVQGNHWNLIVAWPKKKYLTELNPALGCVDIDPKSKKKLQKELNSMFKFNKRSFWTETKIEIATQTDAISCGVYICYYSYMLSRGLSTSMQIEAKGFRDSIMGEIMGGCVLKAERSFYCECLPKPTTIKKQECLTCNRCNRVFHVSCIGRSTSGPFVCPRVFRSNNFES